MTVIVTKPAVNLREELASLKKPTGIVGESILRADTAADAVEQLNLEDHTFVTFNSTGIDDNATSTKLTVSDTGIDVTGAVMADGLTVEASSDALITVSDSSSASQKLEIKHNAGVSTLLSGNNGAYGTFRIDQFDGTTIRKSISINSNNDIYFYEDTGTTPKFFWDASAESLGIGTISPAVRLDVRDSIASVSGATDSIAYFGNEDTASTATTRINLRSHQGDTIRERVYLEAGLEGVSGGYFSIWTRPTGSAITEKARIDSLGNLLVGKTTSDISDTGFETSQNGNTSITRASATANVNTVLTLNRLTTDGEIVRLQKDGTTVGSISVTGSATAYNTSSDYRLKDDIQPVTNAADRLLQLKPINFAWKADGSRTDGFLAHELQEVIPAAAHGTKDEIDADGKPVYQGIDQSKIVPLLTAALQEALAEIAQLKADVAVLKGA